MSERRFIYRFGAVLLIGLAVACAYHNSLHGAFIFDDGIAIVDNPHIRQIWPLTYSMATPPQTPICARPIVSLSLALDYAIGEIRPAAYHVTNIAIHLVCAVLVYAVTRRTLRGEACGFTPRTADALALTSALIFAVHPLQSECVDYTLQRSESMMAMFTLACLYCFIRAAEITSLRWTWALLATAACAAGMGCKEVMVAAPLVVIVYDRIFLTRGWKDLWRRHAGIHAAIFTSYLVLLYVIWGNPRSETSNFNFPLLTPWNYLITQAGVLVFYLRMVLWPHPLCVDYYDWPIVTHLSDVLGPALFIIALLIATTWLVVRGKPLGFVGAVFFLVLAPTSSIIPLAGENAAERRMYLPMAAIIPALAVAGFLLLRKTLGAGATRTLGPAVVIALCALMIRADIARNRDYATGESIWLATVNIRPNNARAWGNLGSVYGAQHDWTNAAQANRRAIALDPGLIPPRQNLAGNLVHMGQIDLAVAELEAALQIHDDPFTRQLLADARNLQKPPSP